MKRCLNCRKTYEEDLSECPYCGYKPRSKAVTKRKEVTQEFEIIDDTKSNKKSKNIFASSSHAGSFYLQSGERLNKRYSVVNVMGFGVFGVAYECFDSYTQSSVVVKEYMPSYLVSRSPNGREVEPLSDEAEVTFSIGLDSFTDESNKLHDNNVSCIPEMVECFNQNNTSYVVTELVHGEALSSIIRRKGKLSYHATITIITGVLQGLRQLNKLGIIHGDICPDNIIVTNDSEVYLLDYNLSDFNKNVYTQRDSGKLRAGYSALEMYYMNMEQGPWTDVYAAAATMYKMLTGVTVPSAIKRKTSDSVTSLSKIGIPITPGAEKAMLKALRVDYEKRTQNPEDFLNGLMGDGFDNISVDKESESYSQPKPPSRPIQKQKSHNPNKVLNGILVFLILAIIAVLIWLFVSGIFMLPEAITNLLSSKDDGAIDTLSDYVDDSREDDEQSDVNSNPLDGYLDDINSNMSSILDNIESNFTEDVSEFTSEWFGGDESYNVDDYIESYVEPDADEYYDYDYDYDYDNNSSYYTESYSETTSEKAPSDSSSQTDSNSVGDMVNSIGNSIFNYFG